VRERLHRGGYRRTKSLVLLLGGDLGRPERWDIRPIWDEAGWQAHTQLKRLDWRESAIRYGEDPEDTSIPDAIAIAGRMKCPPVEYLLAYADGQVVGHCSCWEGLDGVGQVEDLFVHPDYRGRGIASALLARAVVRARERGAGPTVIVVDASNDAQRLYRSLGWRDLASCEQYQRAANEPPAITPL
jgi:ribosomal protein S18 acetylase RimI-like enzyme